MAKKPHAVCVPYPAQGHVHPFMQLAKLLHSLGFHITFVNTEFNHKRLAKSLGPDFLAGLPDFRFETISDGMPPSEMDATQDIPTLCESTRKHSFAPLKELIMKLNSSQEGGVPPVSCIIHDGSMFFAEKVAQELGIQGFWFWTASACGLLGYLQYEELIKRGILPFQDEGFDVDGTLDTTLDGVKGFEDIQLKYLPSIVRVTSLDNKFSNFQSTMAHTCVKSSSPIIFNTFQELESEFLDALMAKNPKEFYNIGPLHFLSENFIHHHHQQKENNGSFKPSMSETSLWKSDTKCLNWLDKWEPDSVIYVNYGSITVMSEKHLEEFAWGLANSKHPFLWVMRPDLVKGKSENTILPLELLDEIKDRGYITSWCPQEKVLAHPSIRVFLTHCGWNSTFESIYHGVPMICWPFFAEQQTNCWSACNSWGVGVEMESDVKREEIVRVVREAMEGEKGKRMRKRSLEWKKKAMEATSVGGSSFNDFKRLLKDNFFITK